MRKALVLLSSLAIPAVIAAPHVTAAALEINFWHGLTAADGDTMQDMVKLFEKQNQGIKVKVQRLPWENLYDKLLVSMAAGKAPEVFIVHRDEFDWFRKANAYRIMDPYVNGTNGIPKDDRVDQAFKAVTYNGKLYGIPLDNHNFNLVYNVDHFKEAGLSPDSPPKTGDEFLEVCLKLTKRAATGNVTRFGYALENPYWDFLTSLYQNGGQILNEEKTKSLINSEAASKAAQYWSDLRNKHKVAEFLGADQFTNARASMMCCGPWWENDLRKASKKIKWAPAIIPQFGTVKATAAGSHVMHIPPVVSGKKLDAAVSFVRWMSDHSVMWATSGQIPVRKSALESKEFLALPLQSTFAKMLPYSQFEPVTRRNRDIKALWWDNAAWKVMNGKGDPKQEFAKAADGMNRILATIKK